MSDLKVKSFDDALRPIEVVDRSGGSIDSPVHISSTELHYPKMADHDHEVVNMLRLHNPTSDVTIGGDLTITGGKITFGNGEVIHNNVDNQFMFTCPTLIVDSTTDSSEGTLLFITHVGEDVRFIFNESAANRWTTGMDTSDSHKLKWDTGTGLGAGNTKMTLDTSGNFLTAGTITDGSGNVLGSGGGAIDISGTPSSNQYARWTDADTLEGRSTSQVLSDIGVYDFQRVGYNSSTASASFLPMNGYIVEVTSISTRNEFASFIAPYNGTLEKIMWRSEIAQDGTFRNLIYESSDGTEVPGTLSGRWDPVVDVADDTTVTFDFTTGATSGDNVLTKGNIYAISIDPVSAPQDTNATVVFKWDVTT